jgi:hypothetical protein
MQIVYEKTGKKFSDIPVGSLFCFNVLHNNVYLKIKTIDYSEVNAVSLTNNELCYVTEVGDVIPLTGKLVII